MTAAKPNRTETDAASRQPPPNQDRPLMKPQRTMAIKGLIPSLPERGKIKIGAKGAIKTSRNNNEFQPPMKLDHFVITTLDRGPDGNFKRDDEIHAILGDKPTEIPVRLLYDDPTLNFVTRYACFAGRTLWCAGDGETAQRLTQDGKEHVTVQCPCHRQDPAYEGNDKCKINGSLGVLIEGAGGIGGVWKFRTTSYNSVVGIMSTLSFLRSITGGPLSNIPLTMAVRPKQVSDPRGRQQTIYVVSLEFAGDIPALQHIGHQIALDRAKTHLSITHIEDEARRLLLTAPADVPLQGDEVEEIIAEFYPEQADGAAGSEPPPPPPTRATVAALVQAEQVIENDLNRGSDNMPDTPQERGDAPEEGGPQDEPAKPEAGKDQPEGLLWVTADGEIKAFPDYGKWMDFAMGVLRGALDAGESVDAPWQRNAANWAAVQEALPPGKVHKNGLDRFKADLQKVFADAKARDEA